MEEISIGAGGATKTVVSLSQCSITAVTVHRQGAVATRTLRLLLEAPLAAVDAAKRHSGYEVRGIPLHCMQKLLLLVAASGPPTLLLIVLNPRLQVIVHGLPSCADPESLRVSGDGNAVIMDTSLRQNYEIPVGGYKVRIALNTTISALRERCRGITGSALRM